MRSFVLSLLALCLFSVTYALSASGNRLLVILDDVKTEKDKYSKFFDDLRDQGFKTDYTTPKSDPSLFIHGARAYDHLLILPSKLKALGPALTANKLLDFLKADGNILLALSSTTSVQANLVSLLLELDIHLPSDRTSVVVDHFNYDAISTGEKHDVLVLKHPTAIREDVKNFFAGDEALVFPHGVAQTLGPESALLAPILRAPRTAYTYNPKEESETLEELSASGSQLSLITALQARNSARFTVLGSAEMLEDKWFAAKVQVRGSKSQVANGNQAFVKRVAQWTFGELGVLVVEKVEHWLDEEANYVRGSDGVGGGKGNVSTAGAITEGTGAEGRYRVDINPEMYRIKNRVTFALTLSELTPSGPTPYYPPGDDEIQLEFTLLSPYHRLPLLPTSATKTSTTYTATFTLPDQHGIFNFRVNYKRPFLSNVDEKVQVTVRHFAHDEWPRSWEISGAWPWVVGVWATVVAWVCFVGVWLFSAPTPAPGGVKKVQ